MSKIFQTSQFKRDVKQVRKQGKDLNKLKNVIALLLENPTLPARFKDHALTGKWKDSRDCHLEPDWLLIYRKADQTLFLERTGSHSELFK